MPKKENHLDQEAVGRRIRAWCVDAGITIEKLADDLNVPVGTLRSWLYSHRGLTFDNAAMIADYFDKPLDELACRIKSVA